MKLYIFAVRDRATDQFGNPFFLMSSGQAIRSFTDEINKGDKDNGMYMHPEDYDLYSLGEYDTNEGSFETSKPKMVVVGKDAAIRSGV